MNRKTALLIGAWGLSAGAGLLAVLVWGQSLRWDFSSLTSYSLFPVLGLVAFSLMWSHYIVAVGRLWLGLKKEVTHKYFEITSWTVLVAIVLHPGLLIYQLFRDGFGLPPFSYERIYGWVTLIGTVSLFIFLAYELRRFYGQKSWWRYIEYLTDTAMLAIFYHGLRLGTQLHVHWFRWVWYFYGITLVGSLVYIYMKKFSAHRETAAV